MSEPYNLKVIQYGNGMVEVRRYRFCVNSDIEQDSQISTDIYEKMELHAERYGDKHVPDCDAPIFNPFTGEVEKLLDLTQVEMNHQRSVRNSRNRTVQEIYKYSRMVHWEYFITLTFDGKKSDRYDFRECISKAGKWFNNQKSRYAPEIKYLYVPEMHKDGAWHIHGVIADIGDMSMVDSGRVSVAGKACKRNVGNAHCSVIYNLDGWKYGFSTATKIRNTHCVSTYITKYITKDLCEVTKNQRRYFRSRNIAEPEESVFIVEPMGNSIDEFIAKLTNSLGCDLVYEKSIGGEFAVDYKFFQKMKDEKEDCDG